jgi:hypothetical protein
MRKTREITKGMRLPHIPVNREGLAPDEVKRLEKIREERKAQNWKLDPYR